MTAWLIIACIVGMLSSGLVHALVGSPQAAPWNDICSLNGVAQSPGDGKQDDSLASHATHCAFCSKYAHAPALLPRIESIAPERLRELPPTSSVVPWLPAAMPAWKHRPRGPP